MRLSMILLVAAIMSLGCTAEVADENVSAEAGGSESAATDGQNEDVAEAESPWTRADCMAGYRHNIEYCNALPGARERYFAGCAAMLAVCLAGARG